MTDDNDRPFEVGETVTLAELAREALPEEEAEKLIEKCGDPLREITVEDSYDDKWDRELNF